MIFSGIISLALALLALFLIWSQNSRIKVLEFELRALQKAFMAMRDRLEQSAGIGEASVEPQALPSSEPDVDEAADAELVDQPLADADAETDVANVWQIPDQEPAAAMAAAESVAEPIADLPPQSSPARPDIESALGGRWAVWVGGLALALGGIFLVRYTIEAGLLGPKVRLVLSALLGIAAGGAGEYLRRSERTLPVGGINGAYLPGILTAASAFILFGTVYAAHGYYGFIGQATAFVTLGLISVAAISLSLLHGQAFGGLGLVGSLATPALVSSDAPNPWALFGFLAIVLVATVFIARTKRWWPMASAAIAGTGLWCIAYLFHVQDVNATSVTFIALVPIAALSALWARPSDEGRPFASDVLIPTLATAILGGLEVLAMAVHGNVTDGMLVGIAIIVAAMIAAAGWRPVALPLFIAAGASTILWQLWAYFGGLNVLLAIDGVIVEGDANAGPEYMVLFSWLVAALFLASGIWMAGKAVVTAPRPAAVWALFAVLVPLLVTTLIWTGFGNINRDLLYGTIFLGLAAILVGGSELTARNEEPRQSGGLAVSVFAAGAMAALILAIHADFGPGMTTVMCGLAILVPVAALRFRQWPVWPILSVAVSVVVIGRIAYDPSIVGELDLGTTPIFNWLLPGYAVPAVGAIVAAWQLKKLADGRMRLVQEAFAALFALLTAAILVRHAMNGGKIYGDTLSLAEQAIYTLIAIGGGAILVALDTRSPSPIFRIGSMVIGGLSMLFIVVSHFVVLNPLVTNESTGQITFFNLLLLAYLLPAAAMAGLALYARPKRPKPYVACLGLTAAALAFAYVTLSIRRLYWGEFIGSWKGLTGWETYTYSAAWLVLGVVILVIGIRLKSTALRLASAVLIVISVAKVFLFDMSQLEGVLRALSFIGLGAVLIGIGIFYQRMMLPGRAKSVIDEEAQNDDGLRN